jgi:thymidylate synthase
MPFVDLLHFKNNSTDYMSQKMSEKVRRKKIRENISKKSGKNQLKKIPKSLKKIPESREKLPGFFNPKNLRTLFSE